MATLTFQPPMEQDASSPDEAGLTALRDDAEMRSLLVRMLRSLSRGFRVDDASDGAAGLNLIRQSRPEAVLLDLMMPGQDGYDVLQALQNDPDLRNIPVVVISARGPREEVLVDVVGISRHDGLTVGEAMAHLKTNLDALRRPARAANPLVPIDGTVRALPAGSPA